MKLLTAILTVTVLLLAPTVASAAVPCNDDQPCWVWSKHGNKQRGIYVDGKKLVVKPCTYAKLARTHQLDIATTAPLRGDWWARMKCK